MGNTRSAFFETVSEDPWWSDGHRDSPAAPGVEQIETERIREPNESKLAQIRMEVATLHEKRLKLIAEKKKEMNDLREEVAMQKKENGELKQLLSAEGFTKFDVSKADVSQQTDTFEVPGTSQGSMEADNQRLKCEMEKVLDEVASLKNVREKNLELQKNTAELQRQLQAVNSELVAFENERQEYKTHVIALKDIIAVSKQLLLMREGQIKELNQKVTEIQASLAEKEMQVLSDDLREEYERQLRNIKQLKALYEERQAAGKIERDSLKSQLDEAKISLKSHETKNVELQERVEELEKENWNKYDSISSLESQLGLTKAECAELQAEMGVINQLFSQILFGMNNGEEIDLDNMIKVLEENHDLLTDIVINEECTQASSALPKVLLDLVKQVNAKTKASAEEAASKRESSLSTIVEESESQTSTQQNSLNSASEIVQNLPKVWRVLTELLSHQSAPVSVLNDDPEETDKNPCYKSVQTPSGPTLVLSVSKTFIRLKDLIVEKKSLEKETLRLKQLNTHLETRLQDQEKRLGVVSDELSKTWNVVGKMQKQHQQLHTQEKILRYELAQKRKLLNELKEELEYCREKWLQAREKNSTTEEQWKQLRIEFASRKNTISEDLNNSVESGYSDERESSSDDDVEMEYEAEPSSSSVASQDPLETAAAQSSSSILEVIQDEIAKIECAVEEAVAMAEGGSTRLLEEDAENAEGAVHQTPSAAEAEAVKSVGDDSARSEEVAVEGSTTGEVHSTGTVKTDLVQSAIEAVEKLMKETEKSPDEVLAAREERLKRLEAEAEQLVTQTTNTSNRSIEICTKLDDLHEQYGTDSDSRKRDIDDTYKKLEEDILRTIKKTQKGEDYPSTSKPHRSADEILAAREERLRRLEEESNQLVSRAANTSNRDHEMCSKLDHLHLQYGSTDENATNQEASEPSTSKTDMGENGVGSSETNCSSSSRSPEEILAGREERLRLMEEEAQQLFGKVLKNSFRSFQFCNKLNKLHERYGESTDSSDEEIADDIGQNNNNSNEEADGNEAQNVDVSTNSSVNLENSMEK